MRTGRAVDFRPTRESNLHTIVLRTRGRVKLLRSPTVETSSPAGTIGPEMSVSEIVASGERLELTRCDALAVADDLDVLEA